MKTIETINYFKSAINSTFREGKLTHAEIIDSLDRRVYSHAKFAKLTIRDRSYLRGYIDAKFDFQWTLVEWVHWYDGVFVGKNPPFGPSFDSSKLESAHCYKETEGRSIYTKRRFANDIITLKTNKHDNKRSSNDSR